MIGVLHLSLLDGRVESGDGEKLASNDMDEGDPQHPIVCWKWATCCFLVAFVERVAA